MTTETLASAALHDIVEEGTRDYKDILENADPAGTTDRCWQELSSLYSRLSGRDREVLVSVMRQSQIDAIATLFAAIDGVGPLQNQDENMVLSSANGRVISGGLSDEFLRLVEESE